jgi:DNA-binding CsgD family transcriptional regulator
MNTHLHVRDDTTIQSEFAFLQSILDQLPAVIYINELQEAGDPLSCRNIWTNKTGLKLTGYTQEEITQMGYGYFQQILHPDDLEILPIPLNEKYADASIPVIVCLQRVRFKHQPDYHWTYCHGVIIDTFDDGSPRRLLAVAMDITDSIHTDNQLTTALREINQLKNCLKLCGFTNREKEILILIAKGKTDKEISAQLFISLETAKKHRVNILHKAGVKNTAELVALAIECGLNREKR